MQDLVGSVQNMALAMLSLILVPIAVAVLMNVGADPIDTRVVSPWPNCSLGQ